MVPYRKPVIAGHLHLNNPQKQALRLRAIGSALFIILLLAFSTVARSQCVPPNLTFNNPVLISGNAGEVGSVYLFPNVTQGVDAQIEIVALNRGAALGEIDNSTQGYFDAWQPYVTAGANDTSSLDWNISFKVAGTNTPYMFPCLAVTAIDVDGDAAYLREFIRAETPGAYAVDPFSWLSVNFDGTATTAVSTLNNVPSIDTNGRQAMFQMNFTNVTSIKYRNGSISTKGTTDMRHTCIYFKQFFSQMFFLPVHLLSFQASPSNDAVQLNWTATDEHELISYTVQKSRDGKDWQNMNTTTARKAAGVQSYNVWDRTNDDGKVYYRLQYNSQKMITYSKVISLRNSVAEKFDVRCGTVIASRIVNLQLATGTAEKFDLTVSNLQGQNISRLQAAAQPGNNNLSLDLPANSSNGIYMLTIRDSRGQLAFCKKIILQ